MPGLTYDSGALIAAERDERLLWSLHLAALGRGFVPTVPAPVLAQVWRGGPQHRLSHLLKGCRIEGMLEPHARAIGALCAQSGLDDIVDVAVVEGALRRGDAVVTSDRHDVERVAAAAGGAITIHEV